MKLSRFNFHKTDNSQEDEYNDPPRPFIEHLIELRTCLVRCMLAWVVCLLITGVCAPFIKTWLMEPAAQSAHMVQGLSWTIGVDILLKIMLWGGTALSLPALIFFLMKFIFPGLKRSERSAIVFCLGGSTILFLLGVWMAYAKTLEVAFRVFQAINRWMGIPVEVIRIEDHIAIVLKTIIAFGLAFQVPLVILLLGWIGLISAASLRSKRRIAIVVIFAMAMLLTPPDPISQIIMALPMCVLYELCIWIITLREMAKGKNKIADDNPEGDDSEKNS